MHHRSDGIKFEINQKEIIILQQRCNYFEENRNDKNRLNKMGMNDNNLIQSFRKFKIKYNSSLVKALNILN